MGEWRILHNEELNDLYCSPNIVQVINAFETWSWRGMLKIKWTDRITNDEVFQRAKEEILLLNMLKVDATHG